MPEAELLPANLPTLPTAQMLARLSAEPGRCEMTVDPASPWVAGVIVRTPRLLLALHAVNNAEAQIIAAPRVPGLQGSGDAQLQALLANAAPVDASAYRAVPPPDLNDAAPPPLDLPTATAVAEPVTNKTDLSLVVLWFALALLSFMASAYWLNLLAALLLVSAAILSLLGVPRLASSPVNSPLRTVSLITAVLGLLAVFMSSSAIAFGPLVFILAAVSVGTGLAARLTGREAVNPATPVIQHETPPVESPQALPAPQLQLIELTRARLIEHLEVAERSGNSRDVFEAREALEVHLPEVVERWEALPSWRRRDDTPLRRTLEQLATVSLPDTTTSELEWDATERFIQQKARAKTSETGELTLRREPLVPPARTQDMGKSDPTEENT